MSVNPLQVELSPTALVGLICAYARVERLPARGWALEIALDALARHTQGSDGALSRAVARWPRSPCCSTFRGLDKAVRELAAAGHLLPSGSGWEAGFNPATAWIDAHAELAGALAENDRAALARAVQGLQAAVRTWSKKAVAAGPVRGSSTI